MICLCSLFSFSVVLVAIAFTIWVLLRMFTKPFPTLTRSKKEEQFFDPVSESFQTFPSIEDEATVHLSVVVPAYEEEKRLPPMLEECTEFLEKRQKADKEFSYEIIIVNDGSKDKTGKVALEFSKKFGSDKIRLLDLETNRGKGGAVNLGVHSARGSVILFADADGATKFEDLTKLETALAELCKVDYRKSSGVAANAEVIVCGSRAHLERDAIATRSLFRNILMHGFHLLVWALTVRTIRDTQCGFKLLTRKAARRCFKRLHVTRWAFDVELLYIAEHLNIRLTEVAVRWTEIDGSKLIPFWSWLQMGSDLFMIWLKYFVGAWKL